MKVSTRGRYALRFMAELARLEGEATNPSIKDISNAQGISDKYLEQIVRPLVREGLVRSTRGAQGGYRLARPANRITVGDVLRATEGDLAPVDCVSSDCSRECPRSGSCESMFVWKAIKDATDKIIDGITVQDLLDKHNPFESVDEDD
ncbi:MAG: Rrf2 family transcriptional regulator [Coriobacteriales bacterium]|nr:Rrf2 family transcriptional regulator [Coriobacteriales bacterium]